MFAIAKKGTTFKLALGSGLLAALLGWGYLHHLETTFQEAGESVTVLVAGRDIPRGIPLRPGFFQTLAIPKTYLPPGAITSFDVLESSPGHPLFRSVVPLAAGSPLVNTLFVPLSQNGGLSQILPDDRVAISFSVDAVRGAGGFVRPGDYINILHTPRGNEVLATARLTATLFQAVPVIAAGKQWMDPQREGALPREKDSADSGEGDLVLTVLLNPVAAVRLAQVRETEILSIVLKPQGDDRVLENLP